MVTLSVLPLAHIRQGGLPHCAARHIPDTARRGRMSQQGAGTAEFLLAGSALLVLGWAGIETLHWHSMRHMLSMALHEAARAAIVNHGNPAVIERAFEHALLPLYATHAHASHARTNLEAALARRQRIMAAPAWQIEILSPTPAVFQDFAERGLRVAGAEAHPAINNNYLARQHDLRLAQGWPEGRSPASGQTTLQANTLTLRLNYSHAPLTPWAAHILRPLGKKNGGYAPHALAHGYVPIVREISLVMHTHPVAWPLPRAGKVVAHSGSAGTSLQPHVGGLPSQRHARPLRFPHTDTGRKQTVGGTQAMASSAHASAAAAWHDAASGQAAAASAFSEAQGAASTESKMLLEKTRRGIADGPLRQWVAPASRVQDAETGPQAGPSCRIPGA
ncbi:hypothetical protein ERD78_02005 [Allopusillimonas soli]|uniref:TadE-like protein n=1 Tax=Allopusillimonas soli TaxID=659016 RepID=A0A853FAP6_9BURK|nr:hypothetical protein [Allopusillimonas soli]NYT35631.1 hypothetical protein [Allopusillimonas soli]TEA76029.1 hypothetical protein ERD78_02005 [Allopusillimonas soli]